MNEQTMLNNLVNMLDYLDTNSESAVINWLNMFSNFASRNDLVIPKERIISKLSEVKDNVFGNNEQSEKYSKLLSNTIDNLNNNKALNIANYDEYNKTYLTADREDILKNLKTLSMNLSNEDLDVNSALESVNNERIDLGRRIINTVEEQDSSILENAINAKEIEVERLKKIKDEPNLPLNEIVPSPELVDLYNEYDSVAREMENDTNSNLEQGYRKRLEDINNKIAEIKNNNKGETVKSLNIPKKLATRKEENETYERAFKELEALKTKLEIKSEKLIPEEYKSEFEKLDLTAEILNHMKNNNYTNSQSFINSLIRDYSNGVIDSAQLYTVLDIAKSFNNPAVLTKGNEDIANLSVEKINSRITELSKQRIDRLSERDYIERSIEIEKKALPTLEKEQREAKKELDEFNKTFALIDSNKFLELPREEQDKIKGQENKKKVLEDNLKNISNEIIKSQKEINEHKPDMLYQNLFDTADVNEKLRLLSEQKRYLLSKEAFDKLDKLCKVKSITKEEKPLEKEDEKKEIIPIIGEQNENKEDKKPLPVIENKKEEKDPVTILGPLKVKNDKVSDEKTKEKCVSWFEKNKKKIAKAAVIALVVIVGPLVAIAGHCIFNHLGFYKEPQAMVTTVENKETPVIGNNTIDDIVDYTNVVDPGTYDLHHEEKGDPEEAYKPGMNNEVEKIQVKDPVKNPNIPDAVLTPVQNPAIIPGGGGNTPSNPVVTPTNPVTPPPSNPDKPSQDNPVEEKVAIERQDINVNTPSGPSTIELSTATEVTREDGSKVITTIDGDGKEVVTVIDKDGNKHTGVESGFEKTGEDRYEAPVGDVIDSANKPVSSETTAPVETATDIAQEQSNLGIGANDITPTAPANNENIPTGVIDDVANYFDNQGTGKGM